MSASLIANYYHESRHDLLRLVADLIHNSTRQVDMACRFSHAEFAILLADTCSPDA